MPRVSELVQPLYWVRDDLGRTDTHRQDLHYNAWPGVRWYSLRSGEAVPDPGSRISAETVITQQNDGRYQVRTYRVNTTGPNFRRGAQDLTWTQAVDIAQDYRDMHERYVLGRLGTRSVEDLSAPDEAAISRALGEEEVTPRCDWCNVTEEDSLGMDWDGDEGMHVECISPMRESMSRMIGDPGHRLRRYGVPMPDRPERTPMSRTVQGAHEEWWV